MDEVLTLIVVFASCGVFAMLFAALLIGANNSRDPYDEPPTVREVLGSVCRRMARGLARKKQKSEV